MKILVTGANGFLATNTIKELLKFDIGVIGLLIDKNKFLLPVHENLELIEGDILDAKLIDNIVKKCAYVIHIAAETRQDLVSYSDYYKINFVGTENLIDTAIRYKLKRFIYVSTANAFGYGNTDDPGNEKNEIRKPFSESYYAISKLRSQELVLAKSKEIEVIVINPAFLLGSYDSKPGSGRIILMGFNKKIVFYPPGGKNFVHVTDAARGIVSALTNGRNGESYLIANENLSYKEFFKKMLLNTNSKKIFIKTPLLLLYTVGLFGNFLKLLRIRNELSLTNMKILCIRNYYTNQKAKKELYIEFSTVDKAIIDAIRWFRQNKFIYK